VTCTPWAYAPAAIPRKAKTSPARKTIEHSRSFHRLVTWRTGSEGRISYLKDCFGLDQSQVRLYTAIARHTVLVMAALAACAVTAALLATAPTPRHRHPPGPVCAPPATRA